MLGSTPPNPPTDRPHAAAVRTKHATGRLQSFGPLRIAVTLHVTDGNGEGGEVSFDFVRVSPHNTAWHTERLSCPLGTPVALEFLRDLLDAQHWGLRGFPDEPLTPSRLQRWLEGWMPTGA
jgi:hypothetical protein